MKTKTWISPTETTSTTATILVVLLPLHLRHHCRQTKREKGRRVTGHIRLLGRGEACRANAVAAPGGEMGPIGIEAKKGWRKRRRRVGKTAVTGSGGERARGGRTGTGEREEAVAVGE